MRRLPTSPFNPNLGTQQMDDADLNYLHGILRRLDGDAEILIGLTVWTASDIGWVVEEALQAREWAKMSLENTRP